MIVAELYNLTRALVIRILKWLITGLLKVRLFKKLLLYCYVAGATEKEALQMILLLHKKGLGVISNLLVEEVTDRETAVRVAKTFTCHILRLGELKKQIPNIRLAVSVKLTSLGLKFDRPLAARLSKWIFDVAQFAGIDFEIDIEGPDTFEDALEIIKTLACEGKPFRVTLAANQTFSDRLLEVCLSCHLPVRIVKGAYVGDIKGRAINGNFVSLFSLARSRNLDVAVATHDKKLIKWISGLPPQRLLLPFQVQMLFGVRMFWQEKQKVWTYMPWGEAADKFLARRLEEGVRFKVLLLFIINIFEMLIWRARHSPPR